MSIESAKAFYEQLATDEAFREQLRNAANNEESQNIIREAGYDFTPEDWNIMSEQLSQSNESELSDTELEAVAGGFITPIYGPVFPPNFIGGSRNVFEVMARLFNR